MAGGSGQVEADGPKTQLSHRDYRAGWICPLEIEQIAATTMLDEEHGALAKPEGDSNIYTLGNIGAHNIVVVGLPVASNVNAATVVAQLRRTFPRVAYTLLVGIGGAVPTETGEGPIHLGHVVVSKPVDDHSGTIQYDHGRARDGHFERTGVVQRPPNELLNAAQTLAVKLKRAEKDPLLEHLKFFSKIPRLSEKFAWPGSTADVLYDSYGKPKERSGRNDLDNVGQLKYIEVHRGTIASGEAVIKSASYRDWIVKESKAKILCFETEAAGAHVDFPCLTIRGMADYCDEHKTDQWHGFAAGVAASYALELFRILPIEDKQQVQIERQDIEEIRGNPNTGHIEAWLCPPDPSINLKEACNKHTAGTGDWLMQDLKYSIWKQQPASVIFMSGISGSGKTILVSRVIDERRNNLKANEALLYFFFDHQDVYKQTLEGMLGSLLFQLWLSGNHELQKRISALAKSQSSAMIKPTNAMLSSLVLTAVDHFSNVYLVLDALDEAARPRRSKLYEWLLDLVRNRRKTLHVFLASRSECDPAPNLEVHLKSQEKINLSKLTSLKSDLELYITDSLNSRYEFQSLRAANEALLQEIESSLKTNVHGMFRWAACQLDVLATCPTPMQVRKRLRQMPETLHETYQRILEEITADNRGQAISLLQALLLHQQPLSVREADELLKTDPELGYHPDRGWADIRKVSTIVPGFLILREPSHEKIKDAFRLVNFETQPNQVTFAHSSIREYLESCFLAPSFATHFVPLSIKRDMIQVYLRYLKSRLTDPGQSYTSTMFILRAAPLTALAVETFFCHGPDLEHEVEMRNLFLDVAKDEIIRRVATKLLSEMNFARFSERLNAHASRVSTLSLLSAGGFRDCTAMLARHPNVQHDVLKNATYATLFTGQYDVAKLLLFRCHESHVDWEDCSGWIQYVCLQNQCQMLELLLLNGFNLEGRGSEDQTPLYVACKLNHLDCVQLLLDHGANPNEQGSSSSTPLILACDKGNVKLSKLLLDQKANPNIESRSMTPLLAACHGGHAACVELLLQNGAHVHRKEDSVSPIDSALEKRYWHIAKILFNYGALASKEGKGPDALVIALRDGHVDIARSLLEQGVTSDEALLFAIQGDQQSTLQLILGYDPEITPIRDGVRDGSILVEATRHCSGKNLQLILRHNVDVNAEDQCPPLERKCCALEAALACNQADNMQILLNAGAKFDNSRPFLQDCMEAAVLMGFMSTVILALDNGVVWPKGVTIDENGGSRDTVWATDSVGCDESYRRNEFLFRRQMKNSLSSLSPDVKDSIWHALRSGTFRGDKSIKEATERHLQSLPDSLRSMYETEDFEW